MAYLVKTDNSKQVIPAAIAVRLWKSMQSPDGLSEQQEQYLSTIKGLYLNWRNPLTPEDYIEAHLSDIIPIALNEWKVDRRGNYTRPDTDEAWKFARRWGLWWNGKSLLVDVKPSQKESILSVAA